MTTYELKTWLLKHNYEQLATQVSCCTDSEPPNCSPWQCLEAMFSLYALTEMFITPKGVRKALLNHLPSLLFIWSESLATTHDFTPSPHMGGKEKQ